MGCGTTWEKMRQDFLGLPEQKRLTVLELGPWRGEHSVFLSRHCKELLIIEGRLENFLRVERRLIEEGGEASHVLILGDIEDLNLAVFPAVHCVWASGILYHLPQPVRTIQQIAEISPLCYGWTHLAADNETQNNEGYGGRWYNECGREDSLSGMSEKSFWLAQSEFERAWNECGFNLQWLTEPAPHENGDLAAQFKATVR